MVNVRYSNAIAETLHYLKGIRREDIDKIPKKFMNFLEENASKDYICNFDYTKSMEELNLLDETRGIIGMICLNYWCVTDEEKQKYLSKLNENEQKYQEELREKYNPDNLFNKKKVANNNIMQAQNNFNNNVPVVVEKKENMFSKFVKFIRKIFGK